MGVVFNWVYGDWWAWSSTALNGFVRNLQSSHAC